MSRLASPVARAALGAACVIAVAWVGLRIFENHRQSPYEIWTVRAGAKFRDMDDLAFREMHQRFTCRSIQGAKLCAVTTDGPPGQLKLLVDQSGRVAAVRFVVGDTTMKMQEEARRIAAEWNLVSQGKPDPVEPTGVMRWEKDGGRWFGDIRQRPTGAIPITISTADGKRLGTIGAAAPVALYTAMREGLVDDTIISRLPPNGRTALGRVIDSLTAAARSSAIATMSLPECPAVPTVAVPGGAAAHGSQGDEASVIIEQGVARLFPGAHLAFGDGATYLVDSAGVAEEVAVHQAGFGGDGDRFVFTIGFHDRLRALEESLGRMEAVPRCRTATHLIVVRLDPVLHAVAEVQRIDIDPEALATNVTQVHAERAGAFVRYVGLYGTEEWVGGVSWRQVVSLDPLAVVRRAPDAWNTRQYDGRVADGLIVPQDARRDALDWYPDSGAAVRLLSVEGNEPLVRARRLDVPPGAQGLPSGWILLRRL